MKKIWVLNGIIFLSAFLLFQIELIISKIFLLKFGGSYTVWGAALVFFQGTLLLGYLYSHCVIQKIGISRYRFYHLGLLTLTLFSFPGRHLPVFYQYFHVPMVVNVFLQLVNSIGPVFFVLSTISIIFQSLLAESKLHERRNPYALYAVSNLGSFAGLLSYPFFFELYFNLNTQLNIWRILYFVFFLFQPIVFKLVGLKTENTKPERTLQNTGFKEKLRWFLLSMAGTILFLSVTNIITYEITPMPLLWILPLCIYLISFVLNFKNNPWCPAWIKNKFHITLALSISLFFLTQQRTLPFLIMILCYLAILFIACMFCQNELHNRKPADSTTLTNFYLAIATGGFVGGFLVSWIIPLVSTSMIEYLIGFFIISLALLIDEGKLKISLYETRLLIYYLLFILLWPLVYNRYNIFGIILLIMLPKVIYSEMKKKNFALSVSVASVLCISPLLDSVWSSNFYTYRHRNYYGIYKIFEESGRRYLLVGDIIHGGQYIRKEKEREPITYFHRNTPSGQIMTSHLFNFRHIGILGLGTGSLAAYGKTNQTIDFFEIDPDDYTIAHTYFSFLKKSQSKINFIFGDARLSLQKTPNARYDILIMDAFSGDSIPVHLLTTDAIAEYLKCITDDGFILFNISNRYVDVLPLLLSNAQALHLYSCFNYNLFDKSNSDAYPSLWFIVTRNPVVFQKLTSQLGWHEDGSQETEKRLRPWTDQYSNVLVILKMRKLFGEIKRFKPFSWR